MEVNVIEVEGLKKWFAVKETSIGAMLTRTERYVRAVDGVDVQLRKSEILGLVGESGSGKTTTGRLMLMLIQPTGGKVRFNGEEINLNEKARIRNLRRSAQMIFQDPYDSINPNKTIYDIVAEPLKIHKITSDRDEERQKVGEALRIVELAPPENFMNRYPHELSGGQRQRVAIARALILNPSVIVCDEPVSMLDVSVRAGILKIMLKLRDELRVSILFITHDLAIAKSVCDRIAVMYLGKTIEMGTSEQVIDHPRHPYTRALIAAVPIPDPDARRIQIQVRGEIPSAINIPRGCRFHPRCPYYLEKNDVQCVDEEPLLRLVDGRMVACHFAEAQGD